MRNTAIDRAANGSGSPCRRSDLPPQVILQYEDNRNIDRLPVCVIRIAELQLYPSYINAAFVLIE